LATANLTKRTVDALPYTPDCDYFVWDVRLKGFGVRVTERTDSEGKVYRRKMFVLGYRPQGGRQFRRITLGAYGPLTTEQAREQALRQLSDATKGVDPLAARRAARGGLTVCEMGASYLAEVGRRRKPATAAEYNRLWKKHVLSALGSKPVAGISTADIRRLHRSLHETPYLANRLVAMLGAFFSYAIVCWTCVDAARHLLVICGHEGACRRRTVDHIFC